MKHPIQTTSAILPSAGYNYRKATRHFYTHSELVTLPTVRAGETVTGLGHFFRCEETKEIRRWGFDVTFAKDTGTN
jgi:hypothetical protein